MDITQVALVTTAALLCGVALLRLRQPAIVGYILAGLALGPTGLGLIANTETVQALAELGVVLLVFILGMELDLHTFRAVFRTALLCVALQTALGVATMIALAWLAGHDMAAGIVFGCAVALSSTAVTIKMLENLGELRTAVGQITIGVLIAQDLAFVPMLLVIQTLGGGGIELGALVQILLAVAVLIGLIVLLSRQRRIELPLTRFLRSQSDLAAVGTMAFCFLLASLAGLAGLSPALGAFLAGLVLGNSTMRRHALRTALPVENLLLMVFFLSVGLLIDLDYVIAKFWLVLGLVLLVILGRTVMNVAVLRLLGEPWERAFPGGLFLSPMGEFSFVLVAAGVASGVVWPNGYKLAITVIALSLILSPLWLGMARRFHALAVENITSWRALPAVVYGGEPRTWRRLRRALRRPDRARRGADRPQG